MIVLEKLQASQGHLFKLETGGSQDEACGASVCRWQTGLLRLLEADQEREHGSVPQGERIV